jgi:glutaredoxin
MVTTREESSSSLTESSSWDHSSSRHNNNHIDNINNNKSNNNNTNDTNNNKNETCTSTTNSTNEFVVYGRSEDCHYCRATKLLLSGIVDHIDPDVSITYREVGPDLTIEELMRRLVDGGGSGGKDDKPKIRTVPQILYQGRWIGGYTDLVSWGVTHYHNHHKNVSAAAAVATFRNLANAIVVEEV